MSAGGPLPAGTREGRALARELAALLGEDAVSCAPADLQAAARDGWLRLTYSSMLGKSRFLPEVVARPADAEQVAAVIQLALARKTPVVPIGGGTGASGAALAVRGGIALETKRLSAAPRIDLEGHTVDVQAGFALGRLEEELRRRGMTLGELPEGAGGATVGGFLATRGGGPSAGQLGKAEDLCLALEAVDGMGDRLHTRDGPSRGLDLAQLLLGSEGTLAVFTSARLRISLRPRAHALLGLRFTSMAAGMRALQAVLRAGLRPSSSRLLDPLSAWLLNLHEHRAHPLPAPLRALLTSGQQEALRAALRAPRLLNGLAEALGGNALLLLQFDGWGAHAGDDAAEEAAVARRLCEPIGAGSPLPAAAVEAALRECAGGQRGQNAQLFAAGAFVEELDVAATWEKLPAVLGALRRAAAPHALLLARVGCAYLEGASLEAKLIGYAGPLAQSANRLHRKQSDAAAKDEAGSSRRGEPHPGLEGARPQESPGELPAALGEALGDELEEELAQAELRAGQCLASALAAALDAGATLSHASGVGLARQLLLPREHGEGMRQLRALKAAFDPHGILNPGKLLL